MNQYFFVFHIVGTYPFTTPTHGASIPLLGNLSCEGQLSLYHHLGKGKPATGKATFFLYVRVCGTNRFTKATLDAFLGKVHRNFYKLLHSLSKYRIVLKFLR